MIKNLVCITSCYEMTSHTHAFTNTRQIYYAVLDIAGETAKLRISRTAYRKLKRGGVPTTK